MRKLLSIAAALAVAVPMSFTMATAEAAPSNRLSDPRTPSIPQRYLDQPITWSVCSFDAAVKQLYPAAPTTNCAKVKVPMDWAHPNAHPDVEVAIAYSRATSISKGLMTTNPGGPGGPGLTFSAGLAADKPQLFEQYDLLGFDPRGFGQSTPLRCLTTTEAIAALPTTPDYRERTRQTHKTEVAEAKLFADACSAEEFGQFVSSQQTVYDMEFLRALMNKQQAPARLLNFIGYSYGTWLGGWYADTYPQKVGRFVLDSNMDWTHTQFANVTFDTFSGERRRDTQLIPWIARHSDQITGLGTTRRAVTKAYDRIRAELVRLVKAGTSGVRGDGLDGLVYSASYGNIRFIRATLDILVHDEYVKAPAASGQIELAHVERAWARISPELQKYDTLAAIRARYGVTDPSGATAVEYRVTTPGSRLEEARKALPKGKLAPADEVVNLGAVSTVVRCNDTHWSHDPSFYLRETDRNARKHPFFGYVVGVPMCAFWPYAPQDRKADLKQSPRILMVSGELDPATAYEGALRTHRDTSRYTRLVSIDDEGQHGQYIGSPSTCVETIGDRYVFTGELPGRDRTCGTSPLPEDGSVYPVDGPIDGNAEHLPRERSLAKAAAVEGPNRLLQAVMDRVAAEASIR